MGIDLAIIRAIHVLGVVVWIGGVAFVTTVILPGSSSSAHQRLQLFRRIKDRFAWQARAAVVAVGASGFWMVRQLRLWDRFADPRLWWMHAMVGLWAVFALMLFVAPLVARRRAGQASAHALYPQRSPSGLSDLVARQRSPGRRPAD